MKTVNNLWESFISKENFELAAKKAVKSKKTKAAVVDFLANKDVLLEKLRRDVMYTIRPAGCLVQKLVLVSFGDFR